MCVHTADDMGLGKTLCVISLIACNRPGLAPPRVTLGRFNVQETLEQRVAAAAAAGMGGPAGGGEMHWGWGLSNEREYVCERERMRKGEAFELEVRREDNETALASSLMSMHACLFLVCMQEGQEGRVPVELERVRALLHPLPQET